jgi:hypothetical protein
MAYASLLSEKQESKGVSLHMSGSGSGDGGYISVGGITVQMPYVEPGVPYTQEILDISICAAILQMSSHISNSSVSAAIRSAATKALGLESTQLAQETNPSS